MSTPIYRGLPINNITDTLEVLNGVTIGQLILNNAQASGGSYWPQSGGDNLWNFCFIGSEDISGTFTDSITGLKYIVESSEFIGPRPPHHPHLS